MVRIDLLTPIAAPIERVFDLSRSVDAHLSSTAATGERVVGGTTSGLLSLGDTVTWSAVHFGVRQRLTVEITACDAPYFFEDTMRRGAFKSMVHRHHFESSAGGTLMRDVFEFEAPLGPVGRLVEVWVLDGYMRRFLEARNVHLRELAEGQQWQAFLSRDEPR